MDGKTIYIVFDDCGTVYNEVMEKLKEKLKKIGIFDNRNSAEEYAIKMSREWFDEAKVSPEKRIVSTDGDGNIYEIYDENYEVCTYIKEYKVEED